MAKGYPDGLKGDDLDDLTKILIVVDSYDAMTSCRNYRKNMLLEEALAEMHRCSDSQFDRTIVEVFTKSIVEFYSDKERFFPGISGNDLKSRYLERTLNDV